MAPAAARGSPDLLLPFPGRVDVWLAVPDQIQDEGLLQRYRRCLSASEAARCARFAFPKDRHRFLVTRAVVRHALSRYVARSPASWQFSASLQGRPILDAPPEALASLSFNVSHTAGLIVMGVAFGRAVGIDVEFTRRAAPMQVAARYFDADEVRALHALAEASRHDRFWALWTLKESYLKATGQGLALPLDAMSFDLGQAARIGFRVAAQAAQPACGWHFQQWRVGPDHLMATCVEAAPPAGPATATRWVVPLESEQPAALELVRASESPARR